MEADWFIHHDADEIRESPWGHVKLRDANYHVQLMGFNAIDHTVVDFVPLDDSFSEGQDLVGHFEYCEFGKRPGHFLQVKAWHKPRGSVDLRASGGHDVRFDRRRVFPYKFLLRHYPIRSQRHDEKKVFGERKGRYSADERGDGWHVQYDRFSPGGSFRRSHQGLERFDATFAARFLIERLSGVGIVRAARHDIPGATP